MNPTNNQNPNLNVNQFPNQSQNPNMNPYPNQNPNINQTNQSYPNMNQNMPQNINQPQTQFPNQGTSQYPNSQFQTGNAFPQNQTQMVNNQNTNQIQNPQPNLNPNPIEPQKEKKNSNSTVIFLVIAIIASAIIVGLIIYKSYTTSNPNTPTTIIEEFDKDYVYKVRFDVECESYIYLTEANELKVLKVKGTKESERERKTIKFGEASKKKVIKVLDDLYEQAEYNIIKTSDLELSDNQKRILYATITENEDMITLENYIGLNTTQEVIKNQNYIPIITNSKTTMTEAKDNKIVTNIAEYLNKIVDSEFDETNKYSKDLVEKNYNDLEESTGKYLGVQHTLKFEYASVSSISFTLTIKGSLGDTEWNTLKGYTFDYDGNIKSFPSKLQEKYYEKALEEFSNNDLFLDKKGQLSSNWKSIIKEEMFKPAAWYIKREKVIFLIEGYRLGYDENTAKTIKIEIDVEDDI